MENLTKYYTLDELANILDVDVSMVNSWTDSGKLPCCCLDGINRLYNKEQVKTFVDGYCVMRIMRRTTA